MLEPRNGALTAVLGKDVVLPCPYQPKDDGKLLQVTWLKRGEDGRGVEFVVLNWEHGVHVQEPYTGRVMPPSQGPLEDGSVLLKNVVQADEGTYECQLITFPQGNFESSLTLKVLGKMASPVLQALALTQAVSLAPGHNALYVERQLARESRRNVLSQWSHASVVYWGHSTKKVGDHWLRRGWRLTANPAPSQDMICPPLPSIAPSLLSPAPFPPLLLLFSR